MRLLDKGVFIEALGLNKSLRQAIIDGDFAGGGGGGGATEIFNHTVLVNGNAPSLTGLSYFLCPSSITINFVRLQLYEKNGISTGNLVIDLKKNTTPEDAGMATIFSAQPVRNFATDADYTFDAGTLSSPALSAGSYLRLDVTSIPAGWAGKFQIAVYGS